MATGAATNDAAVADMRGGESRYWPNGTPKIWCEIHQKDVGHTTAHCWKGKGGKGGGDSAAKGTPMYPRGPGIPAPYPTQQPQEETHRRLLREVVAEALSEKARGLYSSNCALGFSVALAREATESDVKTLKEAFRSMVQAYCPSAVKPAELNNFKPPTGQRV